MPHHTDDHIRLYNTSHGSFTETRCITARDVGWSVLDTAFSPDGTCVIYSSWSDFIHLVDISSKGEESHMALDLSPLERDFAIFSVVFSHDGKEILGGASDCYMYIFNRERNQRTLMMDAHEDDINSVKFADESSHILYSAGDDGVCKVWDRRILDEEDPQPVGIFAGHSDGITYIDSKGDGRYLITNSKDQTIKLWDVRKFSSSEGLEWDGHVSQWDYQGSDHPQDSDSDSEYETGHSGGRLVIINVNGVRRKSKRLRQQDQARHKRHRPEEAPSRSSL
uniref:Uncharacterized protein n=1 Tax=Branchiostoma floridae TaxID=7739 RepID=C3YGA6_BRAFL|eukprot:XP_002604616.1 hypothetical protein BRAFLDRAFT_92850 [Branchiostoma floridae]